MYHFVIFNIVYAVCVSDMNSISDMNSMSDVSGVCERYEIVSILMSQNAISNG